MDVPWILLILGCSCSFLAMNAPVVYMLNVDLTVGMLSHDVSRQNLYNDFAKPQGVAITETELKAMAAPAIIGLSRMSEERIENAGGDRDADGIVDEGEKQVLPDVAHDRTLSRMALRSPQIALYERDAGALDGDVGTRTHGDAHICCREGGGVVDAVSRHGNASPLSFNSLTMRCLSSGETPACTSSIPSSLATAWAVADCPRCT